MMSKCSLLCQIHLSFAVFHVLLHVFIPCFRSSRSHVFCRNAALKNFTDIARKLMQWRNNSSKHAASMPEMAVALC